MKVAPILRALAGRCSHLTPALVHTGQHYDFAMSEVFFQQLGIDAPDVHLDVGSDSHGAQTGRVMTLFEQYLAARSEKPRGVVVVGDVNSTMAAALVAVKMGVPVAHVEAGLRSFDRSMPEEINRIVTDAVADLLLVSEPDGCRNLEREGIPTERVKYVGNVMIDTLIHQLSSARQCGVAERLGVRRGEYAIVTLHRPANVDCGRRLRALASFLRDVSKKLMVVFPVHPRTALRLDEFGLRGDLDRMDGVQLTDPLGYRELLGLMEGSCMVVTDSGGIQEETTFLGVPCITMRPSTERPITVTSGTNTVVGEDLELAWTTVLAVLHGQYKRGSPIEGWDGVAAERVITALLDAWF